MDTVNSKSGILKNDNTDSDSSASDNSKSDNTSDHINTAGNKDTHKKSGSKKTGRSKKGLWIVLLLFIGIIFLSQRESVNTISCTPEIVATRPDIIMLGAWWCSYCYKAKKYFQRNEISYCEYDMENTEAGKRLYQENGGGAVPILLIGKHRLKGFNESQIEQALSLLNKNTTKNKLEQKTDTPPS